MSIVRPNPIFETVVETVVESSSKSVGESAGESVGESVGRIHRNRNCAGITITLRWKFNLITIKYAGVVMLYLVPTPIGNLGDMTLRAIETLKQVDLIYAEDTRRTKQLLNHLGIDKKLRSYYEHNKERAGDALLQDLRDGKDIALVSDAGMPCISDPGQQLVAECIAYNLPFTVLPGPTAFATAFAGSGITASGASNRFCVSNQSSASNSSAGSDFSAAIEKDSSGKGAAPSLPSSFCFMGFPPKTKKHKKQLFSAISRDPRPHIFYESPHAIRDTLAVMNESLGRRKICLARELTKIHEEYLRGEIVEMIAHFEQTEPRGEFVIVVEGAKNDLQTDDSLSVEQSLMSQSGMDAEKIQTLIRAMLKREYSAKDISEIVSEFTGERKKAIYNLVLNLRDERI